MQLLVIMQKFQEEFLFARPRVKRMGKSFKLVLYGDILSEA